MACAPSTVPMLGCCGEECIAYAVLGDIVMFTGFLGADLVRYTTKTETGTIPGLGTWFRNQRSRGWGKGDDYLTPQVDGSHPAHNVFVNPRTFTLRTNSRYVGTAEYRVNGGPLVSGPYEGTLIGETTNRSIYNEVQASLALVAALRPGSQKYNIYIKTDDGVRAHGSFDQPRDAGFGDITGLIASGPGSPVGHGHLQIAGAGNSLSASATLIVIGASGPYCLMQTDNSRRVKACELGIATGSLDIKVLQTSFDSWPNLGQDRPEFAAYVSPTGCTFPNPYVAGGREACCDSLP